MTWTIREASRISTRRLTVIALAAAVIVAAHAAEVRTPVFRIDMPADFGAFQKKYDVQNREDHRVETTTWVSRSPSTAEAVIVAISHMSGRITDAQTLFDKTRDALAVSLQGTVEVDETSPQALPARRLLLHTPGAFIRVRLMVSGSDLYQILYVARTAERRTSPEVSSIFASLRLESRGGAEAAGAQ